MHLSSFCIKCFFFVERVCCFLFMQKFLKQIDVFHKHSIANDVAESNQTINLKAKGSAPSALLICI